VKTVGGADGRIYEFWSARQRMGKTTALRSRAVDLARTPSVSSVFWPDLKGEIDPRRLPLKSVAIWHSMSDYYNAEELPRLVVWRLGHDPDAYRPMFALAGALGDIAVLIDEAYEFAPSGARFTGPDELRAIVLAGAHLPREEDGVMRPCHLIVAAQYPRSIHHLMWAQAYTVMCGVSSGENTFQWLRANFSTPSFDAVTAVAELDPYEWVTLRGARPRLPGYGKI
jgi:hypothetical protein